MAKPIEVCLEVGAKRVFASALDWPGWSRGGRDDESAIAALVASASRYAKVVRKVAPDFSAPSGPDAFRIVERLKGNATTDFGAPGVPAARESAPMTDREFDRIVTILQACWSAFDAASARNIRLKPGPRGGGRDIGKMRDHVFGADTDYLRGLGGSFSGTDRKELNKAFVLAMDARRRGEVADRGPRGGVRWPAPYAARRSAWHALDHVWEIEDRRIP